jgi:DNA polymerase-3 subunit delta'
MAAGALAAALLCQEGGSEPCGECRNCHLVAKDIHPDVRFWDNPEGKKVFPIESTREIIAFLAMKSYGGSRQVAVISRADSMNAEAANALLLTLEEPPPGAVLILVASNPERLPLTIISRCQRLRFAPLSEELVADLLVTRHGQEYPRARLAAAMAEGSLATALLACGEERQAAWKGAEDLLARLERQGAAALAHPWLATATTRDRVEETAGHLVRLIRIAARSRMGLPLPDGPDPALAGQLAGRLDPARTEACYRLFLEVGTALAGNGNPRLVAEWMVRDLAGLLAPSDPPGSGGQGETPSSTGERAGGTPLPPAARV